MGEPSLPKFGYPELLEAVQRLHRNAGSPEGRDRRVLLAALCGELNTGEALLLRRGFDRAYRLVVEGI